MALVKMTSKCEGPLSVVMTKGRSRDAARVPLLDCCSEGGTEALAG